MKRIAIIGGGITGLATAYYLERYGKDSLSIDLFEARPRLGGKIRTIHDDGFIIEQGPDAFVTTKPAFLQFARELGLEEEIVHARPYPAYILMHDRRIPIPSRLIGPDPLHIRSLAILKGIPWTRRVRFLKTILRPPRIDSDMSVAEFGKRFLGEEVTEYILEPLLSGLYGGIIEELSVETSLPFFVHALRKPIPFIQRIFRTIKSSPSKGSIFRSFRAGLGTVVDACLKHLLHTRIHLQCPVEKLTPDREKWWIYVNGKRIEHAFDHVICTTLPEQTAKFLPDTLKEIKDLLQTIKAPPVMTVTYATRSILNDRATGVLIPRRVDPEISALTYITMKWPNRAPEGWTLIRMYLGRTISPEIMSMPEDEIASKYWQKVSTYIGLQVPFNRYWIARWSHGIPVYRVGHRNRLSRLMHLLILKASGLSVAGSGYEGVGLSDCVKQGKEIARRLSSER